MNKKPMYLLLFFFFLSMKIFAQDYYPLEIGNSWTYQFYNDKGEMTLTEKIEIVEYNSSKQYYLIKKSKVYEDVNIVFEVRVEKNSQGIYEIASKGGLLNYDWTFGNATLLKLPLKVGLEWTLIDNKDKKTICEVMDKISVLINKYQYNDVFVIREENQFKSAGRINSTYYNYYAPNVGLIKVEVEAKGLERMIWKTLLAFKKREN